MHTSQKPLRASACKDVSMSNDLLVCLASSAGSSTHMCSFTKTMGEGMNALQPGQVIIINHRKQVVKIIIHQNYPGTDAHSFF